MVETVTSKRSSDSDDVFISVLFVMVCIVSTVNPAARATSRKVTKEFGVCGAWQLSILGCFRCKSETCLLDNVSAVHSESRAWEGEIAVRPPLPRPWLVLCRVPLAANFEIRELHGAVHRRTSRGPVF